MILGRWLKRGAQAAGDGAFVAFLTHAAEVQAIAPGERLFADTASTRLRVLIPAAELARRVPVRLVPLTQFLADPGLRDLGTPRAVVIAKLAAGAVAGMERELTAILDALAAGRCPAPVFADLSDDYAALAAALRAPFLATYQRRLAECCTLTVPCAALREALAPVAARSVEVIEDPYESAAAQPVRTQAGDPPALCWFGTLGPPNADDLRESLSDLARGMAEVGGRIELVAGERSRAAGTAIAAAVAAANPRWSVAFTAWSPGSAAAAIARSDFVLLPQAHATPWGRVKSHNRLVETIRAGRLALAAPIPSYLDLADYAWVGEPLAEGLRWALAHPDDAAARVAAGQAHVAVRFSPAAVGARWAQVLGV